MSAIKVRACVCVSHSSSFQKKANNKVLPFYTFVQQEKKDENAKRIILYWTVDCRNFLRRIVIASPELTARQLLTIFRLNDYVTSLENQSKNNM